MTDRPLLAGRRLRPEADSNGLEVSSSAVPLSVLPDTSQRVASYGSFIREVVGFGLRDRKTHEDQRGVLRAFCGLVTLVALSSDLQADTRSENCSAPHLVQESGLTLVGEIHGTAEAPAWVGNVACALARHSDVVVALEISRDEQARINAYMTGDGTESERSALVSGPFWRGRDGRTSVAMVALIERLRSLANGGAKVTVAALDQWNSSSSRDEAMASALRKLRVDQPNARIVALMGNRHASSDRREVSKGPHDQPVGYLLRDLRVLSVLADYQGGVAWACAPKCGPLQLTSPWGSRRKPGFYPSESPRPGYHATINLGPVTLSPPVVQRLPGA